MQKVRMGWSKVGRWTVRKIGRGQFYVESSTSPETNVYIYDTESNECSCYAFLKRKSCCHSASLAPLLQQL